MWSKFLSLKFGDDAATSMWQEPFQKLLERRIDAVRTFPHDYKETNVGAFITFSVKKAHFSFFFYKNPTFYAPQTLQKNICKQCLFSFHGEKRCI